MSHSEGSADAASTTTNAAESDAVVIQSNPVFAMSPLAPSGSEPSRKEIAVRAFLAWEADGCPAGRDAQYWLESEAHLRAMRQAEALAATAPQPAPRVRVRVPVSSSPSRPAMRQAKSASALVPLAQSRRRLSYAA